MKSKPQVLVLRRLAVAASVTLCASSAVGAAGCDGDSAGEAEGGGAEGGDAGGALDVPATEGAGEGDEAQGCEATGCPADQICHPNSHACVECVGNSDCGGDRPTCMTFLDACGCLSSAECGGVRRCDEREKRCVQDVREGCQRDFDCLSGHCGPENTCVFCTHDTHCEPGQVCNEEFECDQPQLCGEGGRHCPQGGVCDEATGRCVSEGCAEGEGEGEGEGEAGDACYECDDDGECGADRFCDWGRRVCLDEVRAALCQPCAVDAQCLRPADPSGSCVERRASGARLERFCGRQCEEDRDCPVGYSCGDIGLGVRSCLPARLEAADGEAGVTCAALLDVGGRCERDSQCGLGPEGFCWEGACAYGCEETGERRRPCVEGFVCAEVPEAVHPWQGACVRPEQ